MRQIRVALERGGLVPVRIRSAVVPIALVGIMMAATLVSPHPVVGQSDDGLIRGWIFEDLDRDGVRDPGELGLAETVVCLHGANWCDHTEWGEFEFDQLAPGTYTIKLVSYPRGFRPSSRRSVRVVLGAGEIHIVDFGITRRP